MAIKDWNGFKKSGDTYIPNDATARAGVTATVDLLKDTTGWTGKNKLANVLPSQTISNVAVTVNDDKSINLNGTPSANITNLFVNTHINLKAGKYYLSGNPSGVTGNEYGLRISNANYSLNYFFEQGKVLELAQDTNELRVDIRIPQGRQCDNELFYPMISELATHEISPEYEPYHESVDDYIWDINAKTGVHQCIDIDDITAKSGAVLTLNDTGFRCVVGTATSWCGAVYRRRCPVNTDFELKLDTAITSGITYISVKGSTDGTNYTSIKTSDVLTTSGSIDIAFNTGNYTYLQIEFFTTNASVTTCDVTITNLLLKLANDTSDAVTDFAMTNRELTEKVQETNSSVSLLDSPAEVGNTGMITIPISDIMQYSDIVVVGYNDSDSGGNRFVAVIPTEIDGQFDVGIPFVVKSSTGVGFIVARIASNALSLTFLDNTNTNITTMYVKKIYGRKR